MNSVEFQARLCLTLPRDRQRLWSLWQQLERRIRAKTPADQLMNRLEHDLADAIKRRELRRERCPQPTYDDALPIVQKKAEIAQTIAASQVVILCGDTGSGKSTQLPKICLELGRGIDGLIGQTQPRRIAARSVASRIAQELGQELGRGVGFKVRFTDRTLPESFIKVMTDGILLSETSADRMLLAYDTLILDEAHERSRNIDFLLGYLKNLLPKRPELKLIVTSATIDPQRFSDFFGQAPIVEVSGRMFPVEQRYQSAGSDDVEEQDLDLADQIASAIQDIAALPGRSNGGDVLVFLPGEREIGEAAQALAKLKLTGWQILPLYARLTPDQQMRIFQPHDGRRVVLATNVAETSLTVPGIGFVIDSGLARIARYDPRHKVQALPIEPISQASARQRAGRCGRLGPGICIRLYSQEDFDRRPAFTPPEILRSNLASVILQMKWLRLGDIAHFPLIDRPPKRMIQDGMETLVELGALEKKSHELTPLGKELASLPVDPRLGRMILAARQERSLKEVLVIAAALSSGDLRLRPLGEEEAADSAQKAFVDHESDFLSYLKIWDHLHRQAAERSANGLRRYCRERYLSFLRFREWQDIHRQLIEMLPQIGVDVPADRLPTSGYAPIHRSLLAGLLSNIGCRRETSPATDGKGDYAGPRGLKFHLFPGSGLFREKPRWIMAAELVQTGRLYGRTLAKISSHWVERLAGHLVDRSYAPPKWQAKTGDVEADESVRLWGLPIVAKRPVSFGSIDAKLAREVFIHEALVEAKYTDAPAVIRQNRQLAQTIRQVQAKRRRRDLLATVPTHYAFYDQRLPEQVYNAKRLDRFLHQRSPKQPPSAQEAAAPLAMQPDDLLQQPTELKIEREYPDALRVAGMNLPLTYVYDPADAADGVTLSLPLAMLPTLCPSRFEWLVPGLLAEKIEQLLRLLPKATRVAFVPVPTTARQAAQSLMRDDRPLSEALSEHFQKTLGISVPPWDWKFHELPAHLRMNFRLMDEQGQELDQGRDLARLQKAWGQRAKAWAETLLAGANAVVPADNSSSGGAPGLILGRKATAWDTQAWGLEIPHRIEFALTSSPGDAPTRPQGTNHVAGGFAALLDRGDHVELGILLDEAEAIVRHRQGIIRLLALQMPTEVQDLLRDFPHQQKLSLLYSTLGPMQQLKQELIDTAIVRLCLLESSSQQIADVRSAQEFEWRWRSNQSRLRAAAQPLADLALAALESHQWLKLHLDRPCPPLWQDSASDMQQQLAELLPASFLSTTPSDQLVHLPRYLQAMCRRWEKLSRGNLDHDRRLTLELTPYVQVVSQLQAANRFWPEVQRYRLMLQEMRVSLFAQELGTPLAVSFKRLEQQWEAVRQKMIHQATQ